MPQVGINIFDGSRQRDELLTMATREGQPRSSQAVRCVAVRCFDAFVVRDALPFSLFL